MAKFYYHEQLNESEIEDAINDGMKVEKIGYTGFLHSFSGDCELKTVFNPKTGLSEKLVVTFPKNPELETLEFDKNSLDFEDGGLYGKLPDKHQLVERFFSIVF